ncbi:MAG: EF-P lysine aminoacylase GenX [Proteobacteria bacterium]|nr:EF-P lysine aminoacylase GenX [Pseudomonadota bacterium]
MMKNNWEMQCSLQTLQKRALLLATIRGYLTKQQVLEVETPILSSAGNTDTSFENFTTEKIVTDAKKSYLRTSAEFPLKRLLCSGSGDVFEIGKVFRRGEISKTHNIEFTMLEWYRIEFDYLQLIHDVVRLFDLVFQVFGITMKQYKIIPFKACFERYLAMNIDTITVATINLYCLNNGYSGSQLSKDEALDYLFATQIQNQFEQDRLTFVTHYPASQAALAQINPQDKTTSLRFEVFYQGHELGNGYQELTDGKELLQRFKHDNKHRNQLNQVDIDYKLLEAMGHGMPNCAGIALGIDRLLMVLLNKDSITQVMAFNAENS